MQTKDQFLEKFGEILETTHQKICKEGIRLFDSGAVDPESYEDNYILPQIILIACLLESADLWEPPGTPATLKKFRREVKNLRRF